MSDQQKHKADKLTSFVQVINFHISRNLIECFNISITVYSNDKNYQCGNDVVSQIGVKGRRSFIII